MPRSSRARQESVSPWLWLFLVGGIFSWPTVGDNHRYPGAAGLGAAAEGEDGNQCWVFNHMPKSGGSTIKKILSRSWGKENIFLYNSDAWKLGEKHAERFAGDPKRWSLAVGGYSEVLRRHGWQGCTWFTLFRDPVARLVSAFYFCRKKPQDQACASSVVLADNVDLVTFARLWGNFGLRQFSLGVLDIDTVTRVATSRREQRWPGWYMVKQHLIAAGGGTLDTDDKDTTLYGALEPAKNLLREEYAAVGILEEFNATLHLFDSVLGMPGLNWWDFFSQQGVVNKNSAFAAEEMKALEVARQDERITRFLRLDIDLYDHAVRVFHDQVSRAGLQ